MQVRTPADQSGSAVRRLQLGLKLGWGTAFVACHDLCELFARIEADTSEFHLGPHLAFA